jgi:hypothetical protein
MRACEASAAAKMQEAQARWARESEATQAVVRATLTQAHAEREVHARLAFQEATAAALGEANA